MRSQGYAFADPGVVPGTHVLAVPVFGQEARRSRQLASVRLRPGSSRACAAAAPDADNGGAAIRCIATTAAGNGGASDGQNAGYTDAQSWRGTSQTPARDAPPVDLTVRWSPLPQGAEVASLRSPARHSRAGSRCWIYRSDLPRIDKLVPGQPPACRRLEDAFRTLRTFTLSSRRRYFGSSI